jgi:hypothetical protein
LGPRAGSGRPIESCEQLGEIERINGTVLVEIRRRAGTHGRLAEAKYVGGEIWAPDEEILGQIRVARRAAAVVIAIALTGIGSHQAIVYEIFDQVAVGIEGNRRGA